jgi:hypothetical protein
MGVADRIQQSKVWAETDMRIKLHVTGFAVAYESITIRKNPDKEPVKGRYQGSLHSQQKHKIADAVEWMRRNATFKPRIFVATTPGFLDHAKEGAYISKLTHNLRNGYGMKHFVWVRELTGNGYPHFHFVADVDKFDPVELSLYWSGLFGSNAKNSIRCGTKPDKQGRRSYYIHSARMAWYLTKYIGKDIGAPENRAKGQRKGFRTFAVSQECGKASEPLLFHSRIMENYKGMHQREFYLNDDQVEEGLPQLVNPSQFSWRWTGHGNTFIGFDKKPGRKD